MKRRELNDNEMVMEEKNDKRQDTQTAEWSHNPHKPKKYRSVHKQTAK